MGDVDSTLRFQARRRRTRFGRWFRDFSHPHPLDPPCKVSRVRSALYRLSYGHQPIGSQPGYLTRYAPACPVVFAWSDLGYAVLVMSSTSIQTKESDHWWLPPMCAVGQSKSSSVPITSFTGDPSFPCPQPAAGSFPVRKAPMSSVSEGPQGGHSTKNGGGAVSRYIRCPSVSIVTTF